MITEIYIHYIYIYIIIYNSQYVVAKIYLKLSYKEIV